MGDQGAVMGWIKLEKDLLTDPRIIRIAHALRQRFELSELEAETNIVESRNVTALPAVTVVLGALAQLWMLADTHIGEDNILSLGIDEIDQVIQIEGFCQLLPTDWLEILDSHHVKLPSFHEHNGTIAKTRALTAKRVTQHRNKVKRVAVTRRNGQALPDQTQTKTRPDQTKSPTMVERTRPTKAEPPEFSQFKLAYPKRAGSQPWGRALQAIHARLKEGHSWDEILDGVRRYADFCSATGKVGTEHVQQASRFCGPGQPPEFLQEWRLPATRAETRLEGNLASAVEFMRRTETKQ